MCRFGYGRRRKRYYPACALYDAGVLPADTRKMVANYRGRHLDNLRYVPVICKIRDRALRYGRQIRAAAARQLAVRLCGTELGSPCPASFNFNSRDSWVLSKPSLVEASSQALIAAKKRSGLPNYGQRFPRQMTNVHVVAYFGMAEVGAELLDAGADVQPRMGMVRRRFTTLSRTATAIWRSFSPPGSRCASHHYTCAP